MDSPSHNSPEIASFNAIFNQYYDGVRNFIYYKSGNIALAEDLAQEAFLILWKKRDSIDPEKVKSYLYTIANNLFLNEIKHQKVVMKFQEQPAPQATAESPQFNMEEEEFRQQLETAISGLPEKNRTVFLMNRIDRLTYKEIADMLGISIKAVEKRMHKALTELRNLYSRI
ncbi:MAG: RNA polymerase sigma-70 factor [Bacteroidetes bacterium]|nr:MAG: RNA polymerase sigma-70 factor [Bacteroidota bacterium]